MSWARGGLVKVVYDELKEKAKESKEARLEKERAERNARFAPTVEQQEKQLSEQKEAIEDLKDGEDVIPGLDIKDAPCTDMDDMEAVNPYYDGSDNYGYSNNCAYCTAAYELRQRGYDVEAAEVGYSDANTLDVICDWYEGEKVVTMNDLLIENNVTRVSYETAARLIEEDLAQHGDGARGQFLLYWANGGGHSVVWEVQGDKVILRDCQSNDTLNVYDYLQYASTVAYFRTDNVELSDKIKETVVNRDESHYVKDHK